ncbi:MAG: twin-arginine translocase TatA/TatE family subunit [Acetobacteraceae bacterium]
MPGLLAPSHIIILGIVLLLIFGPKRLPEMGRSLGHGMREFKNSIAADHDIEQHKLPAAASEAPLHDEAMRERDAA